jgi:hypothetical protein
MTGISAVRRHSITAGFIAAALMLASLHPLMAQQQQQQGTKPPYDPTTRPKVRAMVEAINQRVRELGLVATSDDEDQAAFVRRKINSQLSEDFEKLHSINAEKIAAQCSAAALDYKLLSDATADLKTRATRIKYNVALLQVPDKGEKIRYDDNPERLPSMLPELSRLINSFLGSPIFRFSSPNDLALRQKASRDLEGIIRLSDTINKMARRPKGSQASK